MAGRRQALRSMIAQVGSDAPSAAMFDDTRQMPNANAPPFWHQHHRSVERGGIAKHIDAHAGITEAEGIVPANSDVYRPDSLTNRKVQLPIRPARLLASLRQPKQRLLICGHEVTCLRSVANPSQSGPMKTAAPRAVSADPNSSPPIASVDGQKASTTPNERLRLAIQKCCARHRVGVASWIVTTSLMARRSPVGRGAVTIRRSSHRGSRHCRLERRRSSRCRSRQHRHQDGEAALARRSIALGLRDRAGGRGRCVGANKPR